MFSLTAESLQHVFERDLRIVYDGEQQIVDILPKIIRNTSVAELRQSMEGHLKMTRLHIARLEKVFQQLHIKMSRRSCRGIRGILGEIDLIPPRDKKGVIDARILGVMVKLEHYQRGAYETLHALADLLGKPEIAALLHQTLDEEKRASSALVGMVRRLNAGARAA